MRCVTNSASVVASSCCSDVISTIRHRSEPKMSRKRSARPISERRTRSYTAGSPSHALPKEQLGPNMGWQQRTSQSGGRSRSSTCLAWDLREQTSTMSLCLRRSVGKNWTASSNSMMGTAKSITSRSFAKVRTSSGEKNFTPFFLAISDLSTLSRHETVCDLSMVRPRNCPKRPYPTIPILSGPASRSSLGREVTVSAPDSVMGAWRILSTAAFTGPTRRDFWGYEPRIRQKSDCSLRWCRAFCARCSNSPAKKST
mmetsp:Transcript_46307/g.90416  ORF Transcript_46307/g.90416 Transcript_46307/m.90416 type:complete len:256 (+) Transcript_46307:437-1204(+)